jgi:hypothetical protein
MDTRCNINIDFTRKVCLISGGHTTEPPSSITYYNVIAKDSIRIAFYLDILATDIRNACLHAFTKE